MEKIVTYFEKPGRHNTELCLEIVKKELALESYCHVVVASTTGETGLLFANHLKDKPNFNLVIVTHSYGFKEPNAIEMTEETAGKIKAGGARIYTGTMVTHSLETSLAGKFGGLYPTLLIAQSLRRFGEGVKVCCEIIMMATDAGMIPEGVKCLAVAGTGRGADTVCAIQSAASKRFLDLKVLELLAKPGGF
jgi:hypothetical protein